MKKEVLTVLFVVFLAVFVGAECVNCTNMSNQNSTNQSYNKSSSNYINETSCSLNESYMNNSNITNQLQNQTNTRANNASIIVGVEDKNVSMVGGIEVKVERTQNQIRMMVEGQEILARVQLQERDKKIYAQTSGGEKEIKVIPSDAIGKAKKISQVSSMEIEEYEGVAVYSVRGTKKAYLLFIIPMTAQVEQKINVESGKVMQTKRPWWHFLTLGV